MKNITKILILFIILSGCVVQQNIEGVMTKTKVYCGKLVRINYYEKTSVIQTTMLVFIVKGNPDVQKGTHCYIRKEICYQDVTESIRNKLEAKYFSWNNSEEYKIKSEIPNRLFNIKE